MAIEKSDYLAVFASVLANVEQLLPLAKHDSSALSQYMAGWSDCAEKAAALENLALQDIILLFADACLFVFEKNTQDLLTDAQCLFLQQWQQLFVNYINAPDNRDHALALIKCLNSPLLAMGLEPDDELMLLDSFTSVIDKLNAESISTTVDSPTVAENPAANISPAPEISILTLWQQLKPLFKETTIALQSIAEQQASHNLSALKQSLQHYLENWLAVAQQIENDGRQFALLDVVLLFIEVSRQAFEQLQNFDEKHIALLKKWQNLFNSYLQSQGNQMLAAGLIKCLRDPLWSGAILPEDEEMLLTGFSVATNVIAKPVIVDAVIAEQETSVSTENTEETHAEQSLELSETLNLNSEVAQSLSETETENVINHSIWQEIAPHFNQSTALLKTAIEVGKNDGAVFKQQWQDYQDCWQTIADTVASDDALLGLADVILIFTELSKETFSPLDYLNNEQLALLNHWQDLFAGYFQTENNAQFGFGLVKCLRNPLWLLPIAPEDELMLLEGLGIENFYQEIASENLTDFSRQDSDYKSDNHLLLQEIQCFFDDAQAQIAAMQGLLDAGNNAACYEYLQSYAESWMVIAEIIVENQQFTFADVTSLFAENCLEWVEQKIPLTQARLQLLSAWQSVFIQYLQNVVAINSGNSLCECLENTLWLRPITTVDKEILLEVMAEENQHDSMFAAEEDENILLHNDLFSNDDNDANALIGDAEIAQEIEETQVTEVVLTDAELAVFAQLTTESETAADVPEDNPQDFAELPEETPVTEAIVEEESVAVPEELAEDVAPAETVTQATVNVNPELISMVRAEFALLLADIQDEIKAAADIDAFKQILRNHEFKFQNLTTACNTIGLLGLAQVFTHLSVNMRSRRDSDIFTSIESELFKNTLPLIQNYIAAITEPENARALVAQLSLSGWKQSLTELEAEQFLRLLSGITLCDHNPQLENRKTRAELNDVSLLVPEDVNRELLDSLLSELPVLTGNFSRVIQQIISGNGNVEQLQEAQRIAHTLKGSGNIVGVSGIAVVTHHLEEILEYLSEQQTFPTKALAAVLLESADCLEMMSDLMLNGEQQPPDQALQVLQNVLDWANQIAANGLPAETETIAPEITALPVDASADLTHALQETKNTETVAMTRVPSEVIDKLLRMTGEGSILSEQFKERIKGFSQELKNLNELTWQLQSLVSELDQFISIQGYSHKPNHNKASSEFDALEMEQYNELHTAASRISEVATDIREVNIQMDEQLVNLKYLMVEEDGIQKENQAIVQSIRMVPASTIASRCQRIVRQACRATNKEVDLEIKGADILIDSEILNDMVEPLMHLLRNSIDHGIEPHHIREKFNKPKNGKITLEFSRKGNYAVITCKDDGAGLASGNILQTAIKKGLVSASQKLTDAEIHKLILIPGFSTRAVVTQTSGRGIGMDAIQTKISSIQGQMNLQSVRGEGLTIEITIPLTLSSMLSLLVKCGGQTLAISNRGLRKIHHADECVVVQEEGQLFCEIEAQRYQAKYFAELVGIPMNYSAAQKLQALRIEDEIGRSYVIFVEELLGYRDLLVKNMGSYIPHIQGITGASILGNGAVAPVIDLVEMLHHAVKYDYVLADATKALADSIHGLPVALVIDDSLSARRSVAMLLKDSGLEVETAIDGLDALKYLEKAIPDIILVDLEMPRMNGIELTAHVRNREDMKNTPIIMITSRATEKHRKQAEAAGVTRFMTKPFTEDDLINSVRALMQ